MPIDSVLTSVIFGLPLLAFAGMVMYTLVGPALHVTMVVIRVLMGMKAGLNWWELGRILPLLLMLAALVPLYYVVQKWTPEEQFAVGQLAIIFIAVSAIMVPIGLPLVQAYGRKAGQWRIYLVALVAFFALPVAAAMTTGAIFAVTQGVAQASPRNKAAFDALPQVFVFQENLSPCTTIITNHLTNSLATERPGLQPGPIFDAGVYFFWIDMTLKAAFLDFFEAFDCGTSNLHHNSSHPMMAAFVFLYRAFAQLIVFAVVLFPFARARG